MSTTFVPNLDFSAFKDQEFNWTEEEIQKAIDATDRKSLPVGIHDVTVTAVVDGSLKMCDNNPHWCQVKLQCENAAKDTYIHVLLVPISTNTNYVNKKGVNTHLTFGNFSKFCQILGYNSNDVSRHICRTEAKGFADFIGCQFRVIVQWSSNKVHLQFDKDSNCHFLVNARGERIADEPFSIGEKVEGKPDSERYAEVEAYCRAHGMFFELYPDRKLVRIEGIKNPPLGGVKKTSSVKKTTVVEDDDDDDEEEEDKPKKSKKKKKNNKPAPMPEPEDDDDEDSDDDTEEDE